MHNRAAVLVVDDNRHIRTMVRMILEDEGYLVYAASTGQAAVECLQNHSEGLVVLLDLK